MDNPVATWLRGKVWRTELSTLSTAPSWYWRVSNGNRIVSCGEEFSFTSALSICLLATVSSRSYWMFALTTPKALRE